MGLIIGQGRSLTGGEPGKRVMSRELVSQRSKEILHLEVDIRQLNFFFQKMGQNSMSCDNSLGQEMLCCMSVCLSVYLSIYPFFLYITSVSSLWKILSQRESDENNARCFPLCVD